MNESKLTSPKCYYTTERIKQDRIIWRAEKRKDILDIITSANACIVLNDKIININPNCGRLTKPLIQFAKNVINTMEDISVEDYQYEGISIELSDYPWEQGYEPVLDVHKRFLNYILFKEEEKIRKKERQEN